MEKVLIILFVYFVISGWELSDVVGNSSRTKENEKESSMDRGRNVLACYSLDT